MNKIEEETRAQVAAFLPDALRRSLESYLVFSEKEISTDTKKFSDHHTACKVAIAHVNLLLKLAQWADLEEEIRQDATLSAALARAGEDFRKYSESGLVSENDFQDYDL
jgi:hypothetical protein